MERFETTMLASAGRGGTYVEVPDAVHEALGGGGRIPVKATFDGVAYQGSIVTMGGKKVLGVLKSIRQQLGKEAGETLEVTVEVDGSERTVAVPDDLAAALDAAGAREAFDGLSYSHRREYVRWIDDAKKDETRAFRVAGTVDRLVGSDS